MEKIQLSEKRSIGRNELPFIIAEIGNNHNGDLELAKKTNELGLYLGTQQFCLNYNQNRFYDAYQFYQITDKLNLIFKKDSLILNYFRSFGFNLIEKNINLKKRITNFAMGI